MEKYFTLLSSSFLSFLLLSSPLISLLFFVGNTTFLSAAIIYQFGVSSSVAVEAIAMHIKFYLREEFSKGTKKKKQIKPQCSSLGAMKRKNK